MSAETNPHTFIAPQQTIDSTSTKTPGRPSNPESARQKRLNDLAARKAAGLLKLGRPVNTESKRQQQEAAKKALIASGITPQKGRPKMTEEAKAEARARRAAESGKDVVAPVEVEATLIVVDTPDDTSMVGDTLVIYKEGDNASTEEVTVTETSEGVSFEVEAPFEAEAVNETEPVETVTTEVVAEVASTNKRKRK